VFAGFDELLGFAQSCGIDEDDNLLFGSRIEKSRGIAAESIIASALSFSDNAPRFAPRLRCKPNGRPL